MADVAKLIAAASSAAKVPLGKQGLMVSRVGLGCMGFGKPGVSEEQAFAVLDRSVELGCTFFDTAEVYGPFRSEEIIGKWLAARPGLREHLVIGTKFGFKIENGTMVGLSSEPARLKRAVEGSLKRLQTDYIDLIYQHRVDPKTAIEDVAQAVKELHAEGKIHYFGLSEASVTTTQRAHAVFPVTAMQSELSLFERGLLPKVLPGLRELGVDLVAFSPMGFGILTANPKDSIQAFKQVKPRTVGEALDENIQKAEPVRQLAKELGVAPSAVALAWVKAVPNVVPIPGASSLGHLEENMAGLAFELTAEQAEQLGKDVAVATGDRYFPLFQKMVDTYRDQKERPSSL